jgi:hypothetical protein
MVMRAAFAMDGMHSGLAWSAVPMRLDRGADGGAILAPLRCRGFSYEFSSAPQFRIPFPRRVNLRFALHMPERLFHPPSVVRALRKNRCKHVVSAKGRCAAFALGTARREADGTTWYLSVLQSDLALCEHAAVRDYLRGWRKILFACVMNAASAAQVRTVCLAPAQAVYDVARTNRAYPLKTLPDLWRQIYDRTAQEFGMSLADIERPVNIQVLPHRRPHPCAAFYRLTLRSSATAASSAYLRSATSAGDRPT